ncbi:MAG TPA: hypothetical protein VIY72_03445 [Acidimicrobiales bacterium]
MTASQPTTSHRRRRPARVLAAAVLVVTALLAAHVATGTASAVASSQANAAATWLAGRVQPDGSAIGSGPTPGVNGSVSVALSLAMTGTEDAALQRALGYIRTHAEAYINEGAGDLAGRLGNLLILADAVGDDPASFGTPAIDLVFRLQVLQGSSEDGFYGTPNPFSAVTDQSLAIIGLVAAGVTVPFTSVQWLLDQQCVGGSTPAAAEGGWQGYRASPGAVLDACVDPTDPVIGFNGADSNSTALALQALAAVGDSTANAGGTTFLRTTQGTTGATAGGFAFQPGFSPDPNSTAVVIQTIVALGDSPTGSSWTAGGGTPLQALSSFVLTTGADAGALNSSFSPGVADFLATYQGVWGFTQTAFPFAQVAPAVPPTSTTTPTSTPTDDGAAQAVSGSPAFTG